MKLKLQVVLIPVQLAETHTEAIRAYKKFLHLVEPGSTIGQVCDALIQRYNKLYPEADPLQVEGIQDNDRCDLDPDFTAQDVFSSGDLVRVLVDNMLPTYSRETSTILPDTTLEQLLRKRDFLEAEDSRILKKSRTIWGMRRDTPKSHPPDATSPVSLPPPTHNQTPSRIIPEKRRSPASASTLASGKRITSGMLKVPDGQHSRSVFSDDDDSDTSRVTTDFRNVVRGAPPPKPNLVSENDPIDDGTDSDNLVTHRLLRSNPEVPTIASKEPLRGPLNTLTPTVPRHPQQPHLNPASVSKEPLPNGPQKPPVQDHEEQQKLEEQRLRRAQELGSTGASSVAESIEREHEARRLWEKQRQEQLRKEEEEKRRKALQRQEELKKQEELMKRQEQARQEERKKEAEWRIQDDMRRKVELQKEVQRKQEEALRKQEYTKEQFMRDEASKRGLNLADSLRDSIANDTTAPTLTPLDLQANGSFLARAAAAKPAPSRPEPAPQDSNQSEAQKKKSPPSNDKENNQTEHASLSKNEVMSIIKLGRIPNRINKKLLVTEPDPSSFIAYEESKRRLLEQNIAENARELENRRLAATRSNVATERNLRSRTTIGGVPNYETNLDNVTDEREVEREKRAAALPAPFWDFASRLKLSSVYLKMRRFDAKLDKEREEAQEQVPIKQEPSTPRVNRVLNFSGNNGSAKKPDSAMEPGLSSEADSEGETPSAAAPAEKNPEKEPPAQQQPAKEPPKTAEQDKSYSSDSSESESSESSDNSDSSCESTISEPEPRVQQKPQAQPAQPAQPAQLQSSDDEEQPPVRRRGRPRKHPLASNDSRRPARGAESRRTESAGPRTRSAAPEVIMLDSDEEEEANKKASEQKEQLEKGQSQKQAVEKPAETTDSQKPQEPEARQEKEKAEKHVEAVKSPKPPKETPQKPQAITEKPAEKPVEQPAQGPQNKATEVLNADSQPTGSQKVPEAEKKNDEKELFSLSELSDSEDSDKEKKEAQLKKRSSAEESQKAKKQKVSDSSSSYKSFSLSLSESESESESEPETENTEKTAKASEADKAKDTEALQEVKEVENKTEKPNNDAAEKPESSGTENAKKPENSESSKKSEASESESSDSESSESESGEKPESTQKANGAKEPESPKKSEGDKKEQKAESTPLKKALQAEELIVISSESESSDSSESESSDEESSKENKKPEEKAEDKASASSPDKSQSTGQSLTPKETTKASAEGKKASDSQATQQSKPKPQSGDSSSDSESSSSDSEEEKPKLSKKLLTKKNDLKKGPGLVSSRLLSKNLGSLIKPNTKPIKEPSPPAYKSLQNTRTISIDTPFSKSSSEDEGKKKEEPKPPRKGLLKLNSLSDLMSRGVPEVIESKEKQQAKQQQQQKPAKPTKPILEAPSSSDSESGSGSDSDSDSDLDSDSDNEGFASVKNMSKDKKKKKPKGNGFSDLMRDRK